METMETLMKMMEVVKKSERKMSKTNISKTFCCQSDSTFTNSPNLDQSYKKTSKKSSVYDVTKRKQIQKGEEEEVHLWRRWVEQNYLLRQNLPENSEQQYFKTAVLL